MIRTSTPTDRPTSNRFLLTRVSRHLLSLLAIGLLGAACDDGNAGKKEEVATKKADAKKAGDKKADAKKADAKKADAKKADDNEEVLPATEDCTDKVPNFTDSAVPTNYDGKLPANGTDLAVFAWQHFVALNWQSGDRGKPNTSSKFFDNPTLPVWLSYRHKNEMLPAKGKPNPDFNAAPEYVYDNVSGPCDPAKDKSPNEYNNLDENSQLGLDFMFAKPSGAPEEIEFLFEAKVNEANYSYIVSNGLYDKKTQDKYTKVNTAIVDKISNLTKYGAICQQTQPELCNQDLSASVTAGYCFPCGGAQNEGAIHVKSAWRKLAPGEDATHYFTAPVVVYKTDPKDKTKVCYSNAPGETWALAGLHIIHKTEQFPAYVFATWEHVDNEKSNLSFENTALGGPGDTVGKKLPWKRAAHDGRSLPSDGIKDVNTCVQSAINKGSGESIWQYYQLVGVQGTPVDYEDRASVLPDYFLANNVIESNEFFQSFNGTSPIYETRGQGGDRSRRDYAGEQRLL